MKHRMKNCQLIVVAIFLLSALLILTNIGCAGVVPVTDTPKSLIINVSEDSFIAANMADPKDEQGLLQAKNGGLDFLKTGYSFNTLLRQQAISMCYLTFDLSQLKGKEIESACLQMYAQRTDLTNAARFVDVHLVRGEWSSDNITFANAPDWDKEVIATTAAYGPDVWCSWDITPSVIREKRTGAISVAVMLKEMTEKMSEQVLFSSKEAGANAPRLVVIYSESGAGELSPWWLVGVGIVVVIVFAGAFCLGHWLSRRRR